MRGGVPEALLPNERSEEQWIDVRSSRFYLQRGGVIDRVSKAKEVLRRFVRRNSGFCADVNRKLCRYVGEATLVRLPHHFETPPDAASRVRRPEFGLSR